MADLNQQLTEDNELTKAERFPCPSCGGNMHFNPEGQMLSCPYCSTEIDIHDDEDTAIQEYDFETAQDTASTNWGEETRTIKCESCGAQVVLDSHTQALFCAFCGSSNIVDSLEANLIAPESLVPFKITREKAGGMFKKWINGRWFAPNDLKKNREQGSLVGTYIPYWTYDAETNSFYTADKGTHYYVTRTRRVNGKTQTYRERKTRWRRVQGFIERFFDDVLVHGSNRVNQHHIAQLEPFDLGELVPYEPRFLSGFLAERYTIDLHQGWNMAQREMDAVIRQGVKRQVNGDEVRIRSLNTTCSNVKFKHLLLPIWMSSYKFKDKVYSFMINGQTGEVVGDYPKSPWKITLAVAAAILVVAGIYALTR